MAIQRVNKLVFDISFEKENSHSALQKARDLYNSTVLATLEALADKTFTNDTVYIDKLELDLGKINENEIANALIAAWNNAIAKTGHDLNRYDTSIIYKNAQYASVADFIFFLENGYWQWRYQSLPYADVQKLIIAMLKNTDSALPLFQFFKTASDVAMQRFFVLLSQSAKIKRSFFEISYNYHPFIRVIFSTDVGIEKKQNRIAEILLPILLKGEPITNISELKIFLKKLITAKNTSNETIGITGDKKSIIENIDRENNTKKLIKILEQNILSQTLHSGKATFEDSLKKADYLSFHTPTTHAGEGAIFVLNAGLILLHPYLKIAFTNLGWMADDKFITGKTHAKAVYFLQYILTGKSKFSEHLLYLNKIICGWPLMLPLPAAPIFSKEEKEEAKELFNAFIQHWEILRNTSPQGLIESFIKRNGIVKKFDENFILQVEKKSIDILLEKLPFGINTIKLPWNEYFIYTEWN